MQAIRQRTEALATIGDLGVGPAAGNQAVMEQLVR
ncbi:hypothetical protein AU15_21695 [Marinobacter salarius]|uniref:Uncharacterized protein n=1 Tax=Marinobacter salarius TaxID=1420917 RepID=W5Z4S4_9GAMM|nr:hypothetical protein AU15_21695 [Marinobacter salarius]